MLKQITAWLAVLVAVIGISAGLVFHKYNAFKQAAIAAGATPEMATAVASARARSGQWSASTRAIGTVVAQRQLEIRNEIAGTHRRDWASHRAPSWRRASCWCSSTCARSSRRSPQPRPTRGLPSSRWIGAKACAIAPAFSAQEFDKAREEFAAATRARQESAGRDREEAHHRALSRTHRHHQPAARRLSRRRHAHRHAAGRRRRRLRRLLAAAGQRRDDPPWARP